MESDRHTIIDTQYVAIPASLGKEKKEKGRREERSRKPKKRDSV